MLESNKRPSRDGLFHTAYERSPNVTQNVVEGVAEFQAMNMEGMYQWLDGFRQDNALHARHP